MHPNGDARRLRGTSRPTATPEAATAPAPLAPDRDAPRESGVRAVPGAALTPQLRLTMHMVLVARRWRSLLDERLRPIGQSAARMEALSTIAYLPGPSAQVEIARRIGIEGATLTRMLDTLEADGLVERLPDPSDRRTKRIRLTPAGENTLIEVFAIASELRSHLLDDIPADHIDKANDFLAGLLARMSERLPARGGG